MPGAAAERAADLSPASGAEGAVDAFFQSAPTAMVVLEWPTGRVITANEAAGQLLGQPPALLVDRRWPEPLGGGEADLRALAHACEGPRPGRHDLHIEDGGRSRWWRQSGAFVDGPGGTRTLIVQIEDRSEQHATTRRLEHLAEKDELTGVWNRRRFGQVLRTTLGQPSPHAIGLVLMDVDGFKSVNDTYGHAVGDTALVAVAALLERNAPRGSLVARLAGDEFGVLVAGVDDQETEELCRGFTQQTRSVAVDGVPEPVTVSAGFTLVRPGGDPDQRARDAMIEADVQMYAAKSRGRSGLRATPAGAEPVPRQWLGEGTRPPADLPAVDVGSTGEADSGEPTGPGVEAEVWVQPIVDLKSGQPAANDVSLRLPHRADGSVADAVTVVSLSAISELLAHVARDAGRRVGSVDRYVAHLPGVPLGVGAAVGWVRRAADDLGLDPARFTLAVPEELLLASKEAPSVLTGLRREGFTIAIDDFGRSVGSLRLLADLGFDQVWVSPGLIEGARSNVRLRSMVDATVTLAHLVQARVGVVGDESIVARAADLGLDLACLLDPSELRPIGAITIS